MATNFAASIAGKLKNYAKANGHDVMVVFRRYAQERLIYRLSVSSERERFCLKGGLLLAAHNGGDLKRPTNDVDFNGFDEKGTIEDLKASILAILNHPVEDDGVVFLPESMRVAKDREGTIPGGKVVVMAMIHTAKVDVRIDVGFGNAITPNATIITLPSLMPDIAPAPVISAYPLETVVSEKFHAMAQHGLVSTRMKDYFDLMKISETFEFNGETLKQAIISTFEQQRRSVPLEPEGLSEKMIATNAKQWSAYVKRQGIDAPDDFAEVVEKVAQFLQPVISATPDATTPGDWHPGTGWSHQPSLQP